MVNADNFPLMSVSLLNTKICKFYEKYFDNRELNFIHVFVKNNILANFRTDFLLRNKKERGERNN